MTPHLRGMIIEIFGAQPIEVALIALKVSDVDGSSRAKHCEVAVLGKFGLFLAEANYNHQSPRARARRHVSWWHLYWRNAQAYMRAASR